MTLRRCLGRTPRGDLCGVLHALRHSRLCAMCWGYALGCVPGDPAEDGEVCDG